MTGYTSAGRTARSSHCRQFDLIEVLAARLPFDSDTYSDAQLLAYANRGRRQAGDDSEIVRATALKPLAGGRRRAFEADGHQHLSRRVPGDIRVPGPHRRVHPVRAPRRAGEGGAACAAVLSSIRIVSLR